MNTPSINLIEFNKMYNEWLLWPSVVLNFDGSNIIQFNTPPISYGSTLTDMIKIAKVKYKYIDTKIIVVSQNWSDYSSKVTGNNPIYITEDDYMIVTDDNIVEVILRYG
jgi:hypothetical protein